MTQRYLPGQPHQLPRHNQPMAGYQPEHFLLAVEDGVATVSLTDAGRKAFAAMALAHEGWVVELLGPLAENEQTQLHQLLGTLKSDKSKHSKEKL